MNIPSGTVTLTVDKERRGHRLGQQGGDDQIGQLQIASFTTPPV
jgi:hypothetical protein